MSCIRQLAHIVHRGWDEEKRVVLVQQRAREVEVLERARWLDESAS